jgi:tetratricopeptide (TPR) repeat protein
MTSVKNILIIIFACGVLMASCDFEGRPLTDPMEIFEKANSLIHEGSYMQAKPLLEKAVRSFRDLHKTDQLTAALASLVQTNLELGEFRAAFTASEEASVLMHDEGDVHGEIRLALLEGDIYSKAQMYNNAIAKYRAAFSSAMAFDDKRASIEAQLKLGLALKLNDILDEAQEMNKNALSEAQAIEDYGFIAAALNGVGSIYRIQKRYIEAANSLAQGLSLMNQIRDPIIIARLQMEMGLLHSDQNSINAALQDFRDAVNTLRRARVGREYEIVLLFRLANLYEQNNRLQDAKRYYTEAIEIARSQGDRIAVNYLSIFITRCDLNLMSPEQRMQSKDKLRQSYEQIAREFQECHHVTGEGYLYTQIGKEYEHKGDLNKAQEFYLKAVMLDQNNFAEYSNQELHVPYQTVLGILPSHTDWYELLSALLIKLQKSEEALKTIEFARLKTIANDYRNMNVTVRNPKVKQRTKEVRAQLQRVQLLESEYTARFANPQYSSDRKEMYALHQELDSIKQVIRKSSWQIISDYPNYETLVLPYRVEMKMMQANIPNGALAIEFLFSDNALYIFALTNSRLVIRTSPVRRDTLLQLMTEYLKLLQDPTAYSGEAGEASLAAMTRFAILSTQLYELLLRPVDDLLERSLIIVADRKMEGFPFHAIERQDAKGYVKYVIELTSVDYLPSLSSLRYRAAPSARLKDVVAFGNPTGKNWAVDYELRDVRSFFKDASVIIGLEASWDNLKSIKADILQISTTFSHQDPEFPLGKITFSNGLVVEESTTLPFEKLLELDAIPLMVLSNQYGQGIGLSAEHALLIHLNGTADVFLNAWSADRKVTKFFSEYFYTHLAKGLAPGDAYRQALLNLIRTREVSQPHSWAQFFHFGIG